MNDPSIANPPPLGPSTAQYYHQPRGPSSDVQVIMAYDANKKSAAVAYLLWFFLGLLGAHNFYLGRTGAAIGQLVLCILGFLTSFIFVGLLLLLALICWVFIDAFLIPGFIRQQNNALAQKLGAPFVS